ncbi:MAG: PBP1A family penicillin-binding protein [Deltaproteobacteria bacterium]|jgi:penicillin-binding protein 1A|nr:PBP1A family penicillin-binding protein [Deltaproteobacteria bacterium]
MAFLHSRALKLLLIAAGVLVVAAIGGWIAFYLAFVRDLPDLRTVEDYRPPVASLVLDRDGEAIARFYTERRTLVPMDALPTHLVQAFVAGEDSSFFEHSGIDYRSILRAAWVNLRAGGEIKQGASTITQQMVKGLLLSPERKFKRKIREMILARRIEERFSKQEILYLYLNQIYFGHGAYGIHEASRTYFDKEMGELSVSESALLAGLPKAPSRYSPFQNPEAAEERRRYVLSRMHAEGFVDDAGHAEAIAELPLLAERTANQDDPAAAYFTEEVRRTLFERFGGELVLEGGLTIETTLDSELQRAAARAVQTGLIDLDRRQGYRGPIRRVAPSDIPDEMVRLAEANELVLEVPDSDGRLDWIGREEPIDEASSELLDEMAAELLDRMPSDPPGAAERALARSMLAEEGGTLLGVITAVNEKSGIARVAFSAEVDGVVQLEDVKWARVPDPNRSPYSVRSIDEVFTEGDVARFAAVHSEQAEDDATDTDEPAEIRVTLDQTPEVQGALFSIDAGANEVIAMVGGRDFEQSQFNRVTQARRQPGSAFKPLIYAAALDRGYTPASIVFDRPIVYTDDESGFIWRPRNYKRSFYGPITLREALARSINNATVHLFRDVGIDYVIEYVRRLGIESPLNRDLSLALGSSGVSLLELTRAYAVFAEGGRRVVPTFIRRVTDRDGMILLENVALGVPEEVAVDSDETREDFIDVAAPAADEALPLDEEAPVDAEFLPDPDQLISPEQAYLAVSLLRAVVEDPQGTGHRLRVLRRPLAGKTGTTNDQADAWFMGFSPEIVTGVWVGHDESRFLGYGETGSRAAAPIWVDYMRAALAGRPARDFPVPELIEFARIDRKTGLLAGESTESTVFQPFLQGTVPTEMADSARTHSESRRQLRLDSF